MRHNEFRLSAQIASLLVVRLAKDTVFWHTANETGGIGAKRGAQNKRVGVRAGVADFIIIHKGAAYGIEAKTDTGSLSASQKQWRDDFMRAGGRYAIVRDIKGVLDALDVWEL